MNLGARDLSIRNKLRLIIMVAVAAALTLACAAFLVYDQIVLKRSLLNNTAVTAEMIGSNSTGALSFGDQKAATELLGRLRAKRSITAAALYLANGQAFALYQRDGAQKEFVAQALRPDGAWFEHDRLMLFRRIVFAQQAIGTIFIESDLEELHQRLKSFAGTAALILLASCLLAFVLSTGLEKIISNPIADLARTAQLVSSAQELHGARRKTGRGRAGRIGGCVQRNVTEIQHRDEQLLGTSGSTGAASGGANRRTGSYQH